ncbi:hypothetical protein KOR42_28790 [Thalassoglobus neptunius]|uniref:Uncharacterized protein n=1 Tax=Thalassoglobus neptunius TaxID=1938619 RepID=A0A5C5WZA2_9PLAN|nr:hypothetical protein [Thalassoglobus neptunius]TWT55252.1 hypothetical protein KOR42_28790 [Thalassoglobus neptunius]
MTETPAPEAKAPKAPVELPDKGVILISYPKIVFMWPSWILSIICGIYMVFTKDLTGAGAINIGWAFLIVLSLNLVVLSFDFPRATSFLVFAVLTAFVLGAMLLVSKMPNLIPAVTNVIHSIKPVANAPFYFIFASVLTVIYIAVAILSRFDYWEVRPNELLHHHGVLSDLERFSAPHLRIEKEINDIFEYILLGSGRLILHPSQERRPVVLDNVFFISSKEKRITKLLSALQVRVRDDR